MNGQTQKNIEAIERLMKHGQAIPSKMIKDLIFDCKAYANLAAQKQVENAELRAKLQPEAVQ